MYLNEHLAHLNTPNNHRHKKPSESSTG